MILFKIFIVCLIVAIQESSSKGADLTVERANKYIASNEGKVNQTYRLQYHFEAPIGWINDPNGFIYHKGEYHLFYQYNPYSSTMNKIHWGHAKSKDLVHWKHLPVAMAPDHIYDNGGVFSGTSIEKNGKLYLMYTGTDGTNQVQCLAVSEDGITFKKIGGNPVLDAKTLPSNAQPQDFRDPKIFKRGDLYYAVLVSRTTKNTGQALLYQSKDLVKWEFKSILLQGDSKQGNMWECPDLFELDGKDVLVLSAIDMPTVGDEYSNYDSVIAFVGKIDWNKGKFKVETMKELDHGMDFYATQTLLDNKGRRIAVSWMNMWGRNYPTAELNQGWTGSMSLPRLLHLKNNYLVQSPIPEITKNYHHIKTLEHYTVKDKTVTFDKVNGKVAELELVVDLKNAKSFSIEARVGKNEKTIIGYITSTQKLSLNRTNSGVPINGLENPPVHVRQVKVPLEKNILHLQIFLDVSSVEVFANKGTETLTATIFPTQKSSDGIQFTAVGTAVINHLSFSKIVAK